MAHDISWLDRARIERVVWSLDQRLYDLPTRSRVAKRREVRANLLTAARDIGTGDALRNLGSPERLAAEYLSAELGDEPRPHWILAALFLFTGQLVFTSLLTEAAIAFGDGVVAADPDATGAYRWPGIRFLQSAVTYEFEQGQRDWAGGAWTPLAWVLWIVATIAVGRLWRVIPMIRRRRRPATV